MPGQRRGHYAGTYRRKAAAIRAAAYADPDTRCWRCGQTLGDIRRRYPHARWDCGHLIDGDPTSPLRAECSPCNRSNGARRGNAKRASGYDW